jgi:signal transduction histidine kinase
LFATVDVLDVQLWISAAAATGQLGLGFAGAFRGGKSPLALPLALFCFDLFAFNGSELAYKLSGDIRWNLLDHSISPLAWPLLLHFVLVFTGRRRRLAPILWIAYVLFGAFAASALLGFWWQPARVFQHSDDWERVHLFGLLPVVALVTALLIAHLRGSIDREERQRTRLLLVAAVIGVPLAVTELMDAPVPSLGAEAVLFAAVLMAVVALRLRLLGQDLSTNAATYAWALAALVGLAYAALYELLRANDALLVLGSATVGLALALVIRVATWRAAELRARTNELRVLGRFAQQLTHDLKNPLAALKGAVESELFGYEKGAFTGATNRKPGRVELADGGTLFLDEIGDAPLGIQVKLLRVLQEREIQRIGGTHPVKVDVRVVAATHRDLETMAAGGQFREDLLYRLNVVPIHMPPLRDRAGDVEQIAGHFLRVFGKDAGRPAVTIAPDAMALLAAHRWPGNVRELANVIERLVVLSDGPSIRAADVERELDTAPRLAPRPGSLDAQRQSAERAAVKEALNRCDGNKTQAARFLGVSRRTLYYKLREHGLD